MSYTWSGSAGPAGPAALAWAKPGLAEAIDTVSHVGDV